MGIFKTASPDFKTYRADITFRDKVMGGTPKDPKMVAAWIKVKTGIKDEEIIQRMVRQTLEEQGVDPLLAQTEDLTRAAEEVAVERSLNVFKKDARGLFIESRCVKAMLRENVNIAFGGERWAQEGQRQAKGANGFLRERVFVNPDRIYMTRGGEIIQKPDDILLFTGHVMTPQGPRSNVGFIQYVENARIIFDVMVFRDSVPHDKWPTLWNLAEENGLGAMRSQGMGRFDINAWEEVRKGDEIAPSLDTIMRIAATEAEARRADAAD